MNVAPCACPPWIQESRLWLEDLPLLAFVLLPVLVRSPVWVRAAVARGSKQHIGARDRLPEEPVERIDEG